jgi:hypothetical protein
MKRLANIAFVTTVLLLVSIVGCQDEVLNKQPTQSFSGNLIWSNIDLVKKYVNSNYNILGGWYISPNGDSGILPASLTDDAYFLFNYLNVHDFNTGKLSPDDESIFANEWSNDYKYIKNVNRFLEHIESVKADKTVKENLKGQMLFIRAWAYARLLNFYGGVPIITKTFKLHENYKVKRLSYQSGVTWLIKQLNNAAKMVPLTVPSNEWGRVTKGAVLALKSRELLYAASKLHDPGAYSSDSLYTYNKPDKWQDAANAAKAVIDLGQYSLVQVKSPKDYQQMFLHNNSGIIFAKTFNSQFLQRGVNLGQMNAPNGYNGWSGNLPTQNLVDAFQMKDGKSIKKSPLYDSSPNTIYKNRGLRFYSDIVYNGAEYRGRKVQFYHGGLDSPQGPQGWNYAVTGYTMRKHMNESIDFTSTNPMTPKIFFRLAGIYLNYAEAEYHLGNEAVARKYINKVRERAHMPDIHSSGKQLLKDIQHERRIELVFEVYHRLNDLRRWMLATKYLSEKANGIAWSKKNGKLSYKFVNNQDRNFPQRMYFFPIPRSEIEKSDLKQNVGYSK